MDGPSYDVQGALRQSASPRAVVSARAVDVGLTPGEHTRFFLELHVGLNQSRQAGSHLPLADVI